MFIFSAVFPPDSSTAYSFAILSNSTFSYESTQLSSFLDFFFLIYQVYGEFYERPVFENFSFEIIYNYTFSGQLEFR